MEVNNIKQEMYNHMGLRCIVSGSIDSRATDTAAERIATKRISHSGTVGVVLP
jgi:hypothetical protein